MEFLLQRISFAPSELQPSFHCGYTRGCVATLYPTRVGQGHEAHKMCHTAITDVFKYHAIRMEGGLPRHELNSPSICFTCASSILFCLVAVSDSGRMPSCTKVVHWKVMLRKYWKPNLEYLPGIRLKGVRNYINVVSIRAKFFNVEPSRKGNRNSTLRNKKIRRSLFSGFLCP